jgi:hypothetical protein
MKILSLILITAVVITAATGCKKAPEKNMVDLKQVEVDDSNDYRYIFKDTIQEQEHKINKYKKKDF